MKVLTSWKKIQGSVEIGEVTGQIRLYRKQHLLTAY
jgi:hypothetical protein